MEPPSYEDACVLPRLSDPRATDISPPLSNATSITSSLPPPPTYQEAVSTQPDPFPVLVLPRVPTSPPPNSDTIVHPLTQVGVTPPVRVTQTARATVVVTQPRSVPILPVYLTDVPGVVTCPFCHEVVSTKIKYVPGKTAWCMCVLLALWGLICGCCLIPFLIRSMHDVHHHCPRCKRLLHVHRR